MEDREFADLNDLRPHDIVAIDFERKNFWFFGHPEGYLKFKGITTGKEAFRFYLSGKDKEKTREFLLELAEKAGLVFSVFDETESVLDVSFREKVPHPKI
ncbi:MAG: hypothetical protein WC415_05315 [Patescibacteria group bacterium]